MVVDRLAETHGIRVSRKESKALAGLGEIAGKPVMLAKPQTFMNLSGVAVEGLLEKYDLKPKDLLLVYDELALPFNAAGGVGCISVTANVAPALCAQFQAAWAAGDLAAARALNDRLHPLHAAMFSDASPAPVKYAMARTLDWFAEDLRLPLVPCSAAARARVDAALAGAGLA